MSFIGCVVPMLACADSNGARVWYAAIPSARVSTCPTNGELASPILRRCSRMWTWFDDVVRAERLVQQYPDTFSMAISVHPYRKDALQQLEYWAAKGVKVIKCKPAPSDLARFRVATIAVNPSAC